MNKFVYFIDTEFFIYTVETQATYLFIKTYSVSFDNNRMVQSTTRIYFVLTLKKFITKTKFRQQNVFIPLVFHIKCANNFNNSKTQHQAKNIKVYIFLSIYKQCRSWHRQPKNPCFFIINKSNLMHNIPFIPGGIDNLSRDSRSIQKPIGLMNSLMNSLFSSLMNLNLFGSRPGILYGLPKVHKPNFPLRPIISSIGTHCYKVAKFFVPLLRPFSTNPLTITDTFSFVQELLNLPFNTNNVVMASFDIKSLFTNIPLDETIDIIVNKCFSNASRFHGLTLQQFTNLLTMTVKNCHFLFDGKLYHQKDGVAMGSPLGPLFANIFLSFHERSWLADCPHIFKPMFYRRYVDDCFLIFQSSEQVVPFLDYLNSKHPNIQFTHELENNGSLSFLDINITRTNGHFSTSVFHKLTSTGLFTNFNSFIPMTYKKGLLLSLISRYFNICSSYHSFHSELQNFKQIFSCNGYPASLIDNCIRSFLDKIFSPKLPVHSCSKKTLYFCLPYTGQHGLQLRTQLRKLLSSAYPHISIRFFFRPTCRLSDFFPFKDRIPFALRSHVVYKYKCQCCGALYVGQTRRHIHTRISEHMGVSPKTGNKLSVSQMSAVLTHHHFSKHTDFWFWLYYTNIK